MKKKKVLKVGFDLDGVLLYNPARIIRPIISLLKKRKVVKRKGLQFYVPKNKFEEFIWYLFHKSSIFLAPGFKSIKKLSEKGLIEPYIITARFKHLKEDFIKWQKKMGAEKIFKNAFINEADEQPHLFKEKMIKELDLDIFVEDNWDIVNYLNRKFRKSKAKTKIFWINNLFDRKIEHQHKFPSLSQVVKKIKKIVS
ncbi:MAG: hypothetical protein PVJ09_04520 [Candidatus Woesebacteria bacterium]|jgi:hypothetical protein